VHDHRGRSGLRVHHLRVVLRDVHDLRVGGLDDDHLLAGLGRPRLHLLLGRALQVADRLALPAQALDAAEHRVLVHGEGAADLRRPGEVSGHQLHHLGEERQGHEARLEARLLDRLLHLGTLELGVRLQPGVQLADLARVAGAEEHLARSWSGYSATGAIS
jgi:hypothetical protein